MSNISELIQHEVKDRPAHVRFERVAVENPTATAKEGRYVAVDVDYVTVTPVGGGGNGVKWKIKQWMDNLRYEEQSGRIPQAWVEQYRKAYEAWKNGQEIPLNGTPIRGWMVISPAQQEMLIARGVQTLEDLAVINAEGIQRIGMGGVELKNKAIMALQAAKDIGPVVMQNAKLSSELAIMKANYDDLAKKFAALVEQSGGDPQVTAPAVSDITADDILDDLDDLKVEYERKFGKPPHHRMTAETISRALKE